MNRFVLITRHPSDCSELQSLLAPSGIKLRPYPVLRLEDIEDDAGWNSALSGVPPGEPDGWLVMASPRAPSRFAAGCRRLGAEHLLALPTATVGTSTAKAADEAGFDVRMVGPGNGQGLAVQLSEELDTKGPVVFACGRERRPEVPKILSEAGHQVFPVVVYRMNPTPPRELPPLGPSLEAVVLTSPRAASLYLEGVGGLALPCPHWALGTTTQQAARGIGIECAIPKEPTMKSLSEELCKI